MFDNAADDLRNTAGAPPKEQKSRPGRGRDGERRPGRESSRAQRPAPASAVPAVDAPAPAAAADQAGEGPKKRRRRGGRGRNRARAGEPVVQTAQDSASGAGRTEAQKPERKPRRERAPRVDTAAAKAVPEAASLHKKPGFFNRIASFFGRH